MKIATWNVNGVNRRLPLLLRWLNDAQPDVVALQEIKSTTRDFPREALEAAGYESLVVGERTWNGVALLSRGKSIVEVRRCLPGNANDVQARYLEAAIDGILFAAIYLPNGNPVSGPKFAYKQAWFERLIDHAAALWNSAHPVALIGDFNVIPTAADIYRTTSYRDNALLQPIVQEQYRRLLAQGWTDALRTLHPDETIYTFWDYMRNRWPRDAGLRIDHMLLSASLATRLKQAGVDREVRGWEGTSDHAPVWVTLSGR